MSDAERRNQRQAELAAARPEEPSSADDATDEEPSQGPVYDLKKQAASLTDPDDAPIAATFISTALYCAAVGALGGLMGWWGLGEALLNGLIGGVFVAIGALFVGLLTASIVPGFLGFSLGQVISVLITAGLAQMRGGDAMTALLVAPLPLVSFPLTYLLARRRARAGIVDAGIDTQLANELAELPDELDPRVHRLLDAAVTDYGEIHQVLQTSVKASDGLSVEELRGSARAVLCGMVDRAVAVSNLAARAEDTAASPTVRTAAASALRQLEARGQNLHDMAVYLLAYVARLDDPSRLQLQEHAEQLRRLDEAMAELPGVE